MPTPHISGVLDHKREVGLLMNTVSTDIFQRAVEHDYSKFSPEEHYIFEEHTPKLRKLIYGTEEYTQSREAVKEALDHHYKVNRHHPEYFENGIEGMNLIDLIEMLCDWMAAVKRHDDGDIFRSLRENKKRFQISDQMYLILENTVLYLQAKGH